MVTWPLAFTRHTRGQRILETDVNELQEALEAVGGPTTEVDVRTFGAVGVGDETTQIRAALAYCKTTRKALRLRAETTYTVNSLLLDYSGDTLGSTGGFRPPTIRGGGPRSTVLQQASGATDPLIKVLGADSGNTHEGKVTGFELSDLELRGTGTVDVNSRGTGGAARGVELSIYQFAILRNLWISRFTDGIMLDRPTKSSTRDDMSHGIEVASVKLFQNSGIGFRTSLVNSVGTAELHNVESSYNGGKGYEISSNQLGMILCNAIANGAAGLTAVEPSDVDSDAYGPFLFGFRAEGNNGVSGTAEIEIDGGVAVTLVGTIVLASRGAHCIVIGNGSNATRDTVILGGRLSGNGPSGTGTAGQKALIFGAQSFGSMVMNCGIDTSRFADASATSNPMSAVTDSGNSTELSFFGLQRRTLQQYFRAAATDDVFDLRVFGDTQRRSRMRADGRIDWGAGGAAAVDTDLYRLAANQLQTDDTFIAVDGITTKVKAGAPTDADFATTPPNGTIVIDVTNLKIYVRIASVWRQTVALT